MPTEKVTGQRQLCYRMERFGYSRSEALKRGHDGIDPNEAALIYFTDDAHGWLFATWELLSALSLREQDFSRYSYMDDGGVYAEEDRDGTILYRAFDKAFGDSCQAHSVYYGAPQDNPIRGFSRCGD